MSDLRKQRCSVLLQENFHRFYSRSSSKTFLPGVRSSNKEETLLHFEHVKFFGQNVICDVSDSHHNPMVIYCRLMSAVEILN